MYAPPPTIREVHIVRMICEGTVDEVMLRCANSKLALERDLAECDTGVYFSVYVSVYVSVYDLWGHGGRGHAQVCFIVQYLRHSIVLPILSLTFVSLTNMAEHV